MQALHKDSAAPSGCCREGQAHVRRANRNQEREDDKPGVVMAADQFFGGRIQNKKVIKRQQMEYLSESRKYGLASLTAPMLLRNRLFVWFVYEWAGRLSGFFYSVWRCTGA